MDYLEFLGGVLLFRIARDNMDCSCSPGTPVELWLDIELENIEADKVWTPQEKQRLTLTAKIADLLDDRKDWLLEEVENNLREALVAA